MTLNLTNVLLYSDSSSNKVLAEGSGTISVASLPGIGETFSTATIAHGYTDSNLLFQVTTNGGITNGIILPWQSNDGRMTQYASIDASNLYITVISSDSSGAGAPSFSVTYFYKILIP